MADKNQTGDGGPGPSDQPLEAMAQAALRTAHETIAGLERVNPASGTAEASPMVMPDFVGQLAPGASRAIELLADVNLNVKIELGRTRMLIEDVLRLGEGAVVELDKLAGDPVDVYVNDRHVARGEVLVLNDNFCVRINEIIAPAEVPTAKAGAA